MEAAKWLRRLDSASAPRLWPRDLKTATIIQQELAKQMRAEPLQSQPLLIAALDAAYNAAGTKIVAACVLWDIVKGEPKCILTAVTVVRFPYVPGFLSFREGLAYIQALRRLPEVPDLIMVDGQGLAHPRRCGIATHLGVLLDLPAIGCAKSLLVGRPIKPLPRDRGATVPVVDRGDEVAWLVRTQTGVRPVIVSVGHRLTIMEAADLVLRAAKHTRLPDPLRLADKTARTVAQSV